jgi:hypothetical protein
MSLPFLPDTSVQLPGENTFTSSTDFTNLKEWSRNNSSNLYNTSLGNIGIGTTATTTYKLNVNGSLNTTSLYQAGTLIDFANFATDSELSSGLALKQDILSFSAPLNKTGTTISINLSAYYTTTQVDAIANNKQNIINTYNISGATGGSLSFASGVLALTMPTNYTTNMSLSNLITPTSFIYKGTELSTVLNSKETNLTFSSPLTRNTNTIGIDLSSYYNKTQTDTFVNAKQDTLTATTSLLGVGSNINALDYNKITLNKPSVFPPDVANIYIKSEVNQLITNTSNYTTNASNALKTFIDTKENILTFNSPLTRTTNAIGIDLS